MTPAPSAAPATNGVKILIVTTMAAVLALYLGGYFFLLLLKLPPIQASPLTLPRYAYYYWGHPPVRVRILGAALIATLVVGGMALLVFLPNRRPLHGDARWAKARDIRRAGLLAEQGILLGRFRNRYLTLSGQTGVILAAPPRSGKGVSCVVPNLLNWPGSVLVLDIKKENWDLTAGFRSQFSEVFLFDPFSADGRTARWNPFTYVSDNPYLRIDDVQRIGTMLLQEVPGSDPFWVKSARSLFVGIALYLFERRDYERDMNRTIGASSERIPECPVTIGEVLRQGMASDEEGFSKHWKRIIEGWAAIGKPLSPQCVSLIMDVVDLATQTASSVRKTFTSQLDLWLNPLLDMATSASDFDLRELRRKKLSIFLGLQPRDFERLQVVMNLFFQQAIGEQTTKLPEHDPSLKFQLLVLLDEFTAIGRIPILLNSIAFVPGYNVRVLIVVQTPSQLDLVYGQDGRKIMLKTLAVRIVFPPNDIDDARQISEELGFTTVKSRSRTIPGIGGGNRSTSTNVSDQRRALMLPQEIKEMSPERQLLFIEHVLPIKCHKIRYYADPIFSKRLLPAPAVPPRDATHYQGGRTDDHFRMWEQRLQGAERPAPKPVAVAKPTLLGSASAVGDIEPVNDFSLDFSQVRIPPGRYLSDGELDSAVDAFLNELESA